MIVKRLLKIIEYKGISKHKFYLETNLSNGFLDKVKDIGVSKIENILTAYPEINPEWLLTGRGEMLKNNNIEPLQKKATAVCLSCKEKDILLETQKETISALKKAVDAQSQTIAFLKSENLPKKDSK